jgi:integrase
MIRRGKDKGKLTAKVRMAMLQRARQVGGQRRHPYIVAIWTGLRRSELVALEWRDVFLDGQVPHLKLRVAATKSRRGDMIPLHPQAMEELLAFGPPSAKPTDRVLPVVPSMKVLKADLRLAGIEYGNADIDYADLHAQRKTLNTMLAAHKVDPRTRQAQLRHTDPRLTEERISTTRFSWRPRRNRSSACRPFRRLGAAAFPPTWSRSNPPARTISA